MATSSLIFRVYLPMRGVGRRVRSLFLIQARLFWIRGFHYFVIGGIWLGIVVSGSGLQQGQSGLGLGDGGDRRGRR